MATRPAIAEGISTQKNQSPFHRTHDVWHTDTYPVTHACYLLPLDIQTRRQDGQTDRVADRQTAQHSRCVQHSRSVYSTGPKLDPTRLDSAHDTTGERAARTGRSSQGFFFTSLPLLESDSVWALRPQPSALRPTALDSQSCPGPDPESNRGPSPRRLISSTRHSHLHLISPVHVQSPTTAGPREPRGRQIIATSTAQFLDQA